MLSRKCDICNCPAIVDTKTIHGHWAYLCKKCNDKYGIKQWNTFLAGLSENGIPIPRKYKWKEDLPYYSQLIYKDMRRVLNQYTIRITLKDGQTRMVTEGNFALLRCTMNIAVYYHNYPITWEVVEL